MRISAKDLPSTIEDAEKITSRKSKFLQFKDITENISKTQRTVGDEPTDKLNKPRNSFIESKVGNLSAIVGLRAFKAENKEFQSIFCSLYREAQIMETRINNYVGEVRRLQKLNKYQNLIQKHKEDMLTKVLEENRKLTLKIDQQRIEFQDKMKKNNMMFSTPSIYNENQAQAQAQTYRSPLRKSILHQKSPSPRKFIANSQNTISSSVPKIVSSSVPKLLIKTSDKPKEDLKHYNPPLLDHQWAGTTKNYNSKNTNHLVPPLQLKNINNAKNPNSRMSISNMLGRRRSSCVQKKEPPSNAENFLHQNKSIRCQTCGQIVLEIPEKGILKQASQKLDTVLESSSLSSQLFAPDAFEYQQRTASDEAMSYLLNSNENYAYLQNQIWSEQDLKDYVMKLSHSSLSRFYDSIKGILADLSNVFKMGLRIKTIFDSTPDITGTLTIGDAMHEIVGQLCDALECDRASVFKQDLLRGELWTQAAKGLSNIIRIPMDMGIAGYVATHRRDVNIREAYSDDRFNQANDIRSGYRTKSILAMPILNKMNEVEGVIQAINKNPGPDNVIRYFTKDDEGLMKMQANIAGVTLKNTFLFSEQLLFHNNLRSILRVGIYQNTFKGVMNLQHASEYKLNQLFNSEDSKVYFQDKTKTRVFRYNKTKGKKFKDNFNKKGGILGQCIYNKSVILISNPTMEVSFNALIDIESTMPILAVPIKCSQTDEILGAFEVINTRGIEGMSSTGKAKLISKDHEIVEFFSKQLAQCYLNQSDRKKECDLDIDPEESGDEQKSNKIVKFKNLNIDVNVDCDSDKSSSDSYIQDVDRPGEKRSRHKSLTNLSLKNHVISVKNSPEKGHTRMNFIYPKKKKTKIQGGDIGSMEIYEKKMLSSMMKVKKSNIGSRNCLLEEYNEDKQEKQYIERLHVDDDVPDHNIWAKDRKITMVRMDSLEANVQTSMTKKGILKSQTTEFCITNDLKHEEIMKPRLQNQVIPEDKDSENDY